MSSLNQIFNYQDIQVEFKELNNNIAHFVKETKSIVAYVEIYVRKNQQTISTYKREFEKEVNMYHYNNFVRKFLEDSIYRSKYLKDGASHWRGIVPYKDSTGINTLCKDQITFLNNKSDIKFKDLVGLKTYGKDAFSSMTMDNLIELVDKEIFYDIQKEFKTNDLISNCMRWIARGLSPSLAIYKTKVDLEVQQNKNNE